MTVVWGLQDPQLNEAMGRWLQAKLCLPQPFREPYVCMGLFENDQKLIAVLMLENYRSRDGTVEIGGAADKPKWLTRGVMSDLADYVFRKLRCQMAVFRVPERNTHVCDVLKRAGMECLVIPRLRGRHEAEFFFMMTDDAWDQHPMNRKRGGYAVRSS